MESQKLIELKASAYNALVMIEQWQARLKQINESIQAQMTIDNSQAKTGGDGDTKDKGDQSGEETGEGKR